MTDTPTPTVTATTADVLRGAAQLIRSNGFGKGAEALFTEKMCMGKAIAVAGGELDPGAVYRVLVERLYRAPVDGNVLRAIIRWNDRPETTQELAVKELEAAAAAAEEGAL